MKIFDLDQLQKSKETDLYDLTLNSFEYVRNIQYSTYKVQRGEEMRMDLVCQSIYGNIDSIDLLLNINNISNPLNIKEGTIIIYPTTSDIAPMRTDNKDKTDTLKILANSNKSSRVDKGRQKYIESNYSLPPTILQSSVDQTKIDGGSIKLGEGLFNK